MIHTQGDQYAPVTVPSIINKTTNHINRASITENIFLWTLEQLSVIQALEMAFVIFDGFYSTGKSDVLKYYGKDKLKKGCILHYFNHRSIQDKGSNNSLPFTMMLQNEFPDGVVKETTFRFGVDSVSGFLDQHGIKPDHHVIFDELICNEFTKRFLNSLVALKLNVASLWIAVGSIPIIGKLNCQVLKFLP